MAGSAAAAVGAGEQEQEQDGASEEEEDDEGGGVPLGLEQPAAPQFPQHFLGHCLRLLL